MKERKRTAIIKALTKAGWADAIMIDWEKAGDLHLQAEEWVEEKGMAADYYAEFPWGLDDYGVNLEIAKILKKYKAEAEWHNPGVLCVHEH